MTETMRQVGANTRAVMRPTAAMGPLRGPGGTVHVSVLKCFKAVVLECGGSPHELLRSAKLSEDLLDNLAGNVRVPYPLVVELFNGAAHVLRRPDFGMKLASAQARSGFAGPLSIAMQNSENLGAAFRILSERIYTYSECTGFTSIKEAQLGRSILRIDILPPDNLDERQSVEHAVLTTHLMASLMTDGQVNSQEIWLRHAAMSSGSNYQHYFKTQVRFSQPLNAVVIKASDELVPVVGRNEEVYHLATSFIESHYPKPQDPFRDKVRRVLSQHKNIRFATTAQVARSFGMNPRTFQRRLRDDGVRFSAIKDQVCQELALRYLRHTRLPLARIAGMLGYSELSSFSHRCHHWFSCPPGELRRRAQ